jgi:hypothetical protein
MSEQILLFFTTIKRPQYHRDIVNALCYPPGGLIAFAYHNDWIPEGLRNAEALKNMQGLIVFCERTEAGYAYYPIRWCKVEYCEQKYDGFMFILNLTDYETYELDREQLQTHLQSFATYVTQSQEQPTPRQREGNGIVKKRFLRSEFKWPESRTTKRGQSVIKHCASLPSFANDCFVTLVDEQQGIRFTPEMRAPKRQSWWTTNVNHQRTLHWRTLPFLTGARMSIQTWTVLGKSLSRGEATVSISSDVGSVSGALAFQAPEGVYATHHVRLKYSNLLDSGFLDIMGAGTELAYSSRYGAHIESRPRRFAQYSAIALLALGPVVASMASRGWGKPDKADILRLGSAVLTGFGAWLALRKIKV